MAYRYSRPAMTGATIFTLAGVTVLPLAQANAMPVNSQDEARSGATQSQPNSASQNKQNNQSRQNQPAAPANQNYGSSVVITSVDGFLDPHKSENNLIVHGTGLNENHTLHYTSTVQELDEFGNVVNDDVSVGKTGVAFEDGGFFEQLITVEGAKINPNHQYRVRINAYDQDAMTTSYAYYLVAVWNRSYVPVIPLSATQ